MIHLLLNTFVFGLAPASVDKKSTDEDVERGVNVRSGKTWRGKSVMAQSKSSRVTATLVDAYSSHGENDSDEVDRTFMLYGYPVRLPKCCAPSHCCCSSSRKVIQEEQEIENQDVELFQHDPKFWQQPSRWIHYFVHTV